MTGSGEASEAPMRELLVNLLKIPSVSGSEGPLTRFVADWAQRAGFEIDLWQAELTGLERFDWTIGRHLPLAGRPTLVLRLPGTGGGRSLIFNAHADVVSAGDVSCWQHDPWGGEIVGDRAFGRGACDVKGPLVSALWAMMLLRDHPPAGDVLLELIPGEEDCVGLGTLTSVARGWSADGCVILEPTENQPCIASRGGLRFEVAVLGRSVHGTVKWLGVDAIDHARIILDRLKSMEAMFNDRSADSMFTHYPIARPITVDTLHGGLWQGMVCDLCQVGGYFELLPGDEPQAWKQRFEVELRRAVGLNLNLDLAFPETYFGHRIDSAHPLANAAAAKEFRGFNSGCEAGLRATIQGTPTLVWGPGSLAQAHAADEYVDFTDVRWCANQFAALARRWCGSNGSLNDVD